MTSATIPADSQIPEFVLRNYSVEKWYQFATSYLSSGGYLLGYPRYITRKSETGLALILERRGSPVVLRLR